MTKPKEFRSTCITTCEIPYEVQDGALKGTHASKGILENGRVVWLKAQSEEERPDFMVPAYAEGVGIILLDSRRVAPQG